MMRLPTATTLDDLAADPAKSGPAGSNEVKSGGGAEPEELERAIEVLEAATVPTEPDAAVELTTANDGETAGQAGALALSTQGGPLVVEIELEPLALHPLLPPSLWEVGTVEPAVGFWGSYRLFILTVVVPMLIASIYLFAIATPRFASSASFIVRSVTDSGAPQQSVATTPMTQQAASATPQTQPGQGSTPALPMPLQSTSPMLNPSSLQSPLPGQTGVTTIAESETYAISAYLTSRDVVDRLVKSNGLREILSRAEGDFVYRYPTFWLPDNNELLYQRFKWAVSADVDDSTLISKIEVNAFRAEDAQALATALLKYAEELVNKMNQRSYEDGLAVANRFVAEAQKDVDAVEAELKTYRSTTSSIDPNLVALSKLQVIGTLSTQLAQIEATIAQLKVITPTSPNLAALRAQAEAYRAEIDKRKHEIAGPAGSEADKLETYDELTTRAGLAATSLAAAIAERDQARETAMRQHLFIQVIARPNLALDYARYPRRVLDLLVLLAICLTAFQILRKVADSRAQHGS